MPRIAQRFNVGGARSVLRKSRRIIGIENGDLYSPATGKDAVRNAFHGRGLAIIQSGHEAGRIHMTAQADGLQEAIADVEALGQP
jgi:hypothetical protein